jgi:phage baseplate assembly protein W
MFLNIKYPLTNDNTLLFDGDMTSKNVVKSHILLLLLTEKTERYFKPNYGTNLKRFIFSPNDNITIGEIETDIRNTLSQFIPKLTVDSIVFNSEITDSSINKNTVICTINFSYTEEYFAYNDSLEIVFEDLL